MLHGRHHDSGISAVLFLSSAFCVQRSFAILSTLDPTVATWKNSSPPALMHGLSRNR